MFHDGFAPPNTYNGFLTPSDNNAQQVVVDHHEYSCFTNDLVAMEKFAKSKRVWLEKYLSLPDDTPCHDTFGRVFAALDGVDLEFTPDALEAIADQANLRGTGARGLRAIMEEVLQPVMYEVPSRKDVERVVITREAVLENVNPTLVPRDVSRRTPREKSA